MTADRRQPPCSSSEDSGGWAGSQHRPMLRLSDPPLLTSPDRVLKLVWSGLRLPVFILMRTLRFILVRLGTAFPVTHSG